MANPIYRQIAGDQRAQIAPGDLAAGSRLPAELDLRHRYSASRNAVRDTIKRLARNSEVISPPERRFIDTRPWSMQTSYYPMEFASDVKAQEIQETSHPSEDPLDRLNRPMEAAKRGNMDKIQHLLDSRRAVIRRGLRPEGEL